MSAAKHTPLPWFLDSRIAWVKGRARYYQRTTSMSRRDCVAAASDAYAQACSACAESQS
jgi:hypothetical protein